MRVVLRKWTHPIGFVHFRKGVAFTAKFSKSICTMGVCFRKDERR